MKTRLALLLLGFTTFAFAEVSQTGLQISIAGDIVGRFGKFNDANNNRLEAREAEVLFYAPIDHLFDGTTSLAAHQENGMANFEVHELYIGSTKLIPRSRFRLGQFFLAVGRLNQFHRHDWPFTTAPKVHSTFFNEEGVLDTGLEYSYLFPTSMYLDLTVGMTNGWIFGHAHNIGSKPFFPTHYGRLATYAPLMGGGAQIGLNYLGRREQNETDTKLLGVDLTAKWRENQTLLFLFQSEVWYRLLTLKDTETEKTLGFYLYPQYGISQELSVGVRLDGFTVTTLGVGNFSYGLVPSVSYKASEFSTFRASYSMTGDMLGGNEISNERIFELQAVFLLGSHPTHDF